MRCRPGTHIVEREQSEHSELAGLAKFMQVIVEPGCEQVKPRLIRFTPRRCRVTPMGSHDVNEAVPASDVESRGNQVLKRALMCGAPLVAQTTAEWSGSPKLATVVNDDAIKDDRANMVGPVVRVARPTVMPEDPLISKLKSRTQPFVDLRVKISHQVPHTLTDQ
jgi:hypothetical protein